MKRHRSRKAMLVATAAILGVGALISVAKISLDPPYRIHKPIVAQTEPTPAMSVTKRPTLFATRHVYEGIQTPDGKVESPLGPDNQMTRAGIEHLIDCVWEGLLRTETGDQELSPRLCKIRDLLILTPDAYAEHGLQAVSDVFDIIERSKTDIAVLDAYYERIKAAKN